MSSLYSLIPEGEASIENAVAALLSFFVLKMPCTDGSNIRMSSLYSLIPDGEASIKNAVAALLSFFVL